TPGTPKVAQIGETKKPALSCGLPDRRGTGSEDVTLFLVLSYIKALALVVRVGPQAEYELHGEPDGRRRDDGQEQGHGDREELLVPEAAVGDKSREAVGLRRGVRRGQVGVDRRRCEQARHEGAERPPDGVDAERVQRVVVAEDGLQLDAEDEWDRPGEQPDDDGAGGV